MKIKLDENMPASLAADLTSLGHDVETTPQEDLTGASDAQIWAQAQQEGRFLITQDLDFSDVRQFTPGTHSGLLLVRLRDPGRLALREKVLWLFENEDITEWPDCFIVASDQKIRVRRPANR